MKKTLYQILGVHQDASIERIKAAYEQMYEGPGAHDPALRVAVREAFEILTDPQRRAAYDARLAATGPSAARVTVEETVDEPTGLSALVAHPWFKWVVGALIFLAVIFWWRSRMAKKAPPAPPVVVQQPVIVSQSTLPASEPAEPAATQAAAEPAATQAAAPVAATATAAPASVRSAADVFAEASPSIVLVTVHARSGAQVASGSGVVVDSEKVITNCHVMKGAAEVRVKAGKQTLDALPGLADEEFDLCRLNVAGLKAPAVTVGSAASLRPGQKVFAIGAPQGLELTLSDGIVASLRPVPDGTVIQTTAPISAGSSGGGLFDESGALVGITTFQHRYGQNLNFAVPADWIGQMRSRRVGAAGSSTLPTGQAMVSEDKMILGKWLCRGSLTGMNGEFEFREDGILLGRFDDKLAGARYHLSGRVLRLYGRQSMTYGVDSITPDKMVFDAGEGNRIICER